MSSLDIFKGSRVLVTGHTGFKGSWLSFWLELLGSNVFGLSLDVPTSPSHFEHLDLGLKDRDIRLDISKADGLTAIIKKVKPDFIFHLAAQALVRQAHVDPLGTWQTNTFGTLNVLSALREAEHNCVAIFVTSDKSYDNVEWEWGYRETDALGGSDPYSASKGGAELAIRSFVRSFFPQNGAIRVGVARAGNVIGGGDWAADRLVPDSVVAWSRGDSVVLRSPSATRPWQHVLEPLSGYLNLAIALHKGKSLHGEAFNFGPPANQDFSVEKLVEEMSKHWKKVKWRTQTPIENGPSESTLLKLNCDKALHYLGWEATWDFEATVRETVYWYKHFYEASNVDVKAVSESQIKSFCGAAAQKGLKWAK